MDYEHDLIFLKEIGSSATQSGVLRSTLVVYHHGSVEECRMDVIDGLQC